MLRGPHPYFNTRMVKVRVEVSVGVGAWGVVPAEAGLVGLGKVDSGGFELRCDSLTMRSSHALQQVPSATVNNHRAASKFLIFIDATIIHLVVAPRRCPWASISTARRALPRSCIVA